MNISPGNITLCKGTPLGEFIPIFNVCVVEDNQDRQQQKNEPVAIYLT